MFARVSTYGIVLAALLMTACSQNETDLKTVPEKEPVAISFTCTTALTTDLNDEATTRTDTEPGYDEQLRYTGFGVFATVGDSEYPDLMYNQQVVYTYLADDFENGFWSYSPVKFWPKVGDNLAEEVTFSAYAPYAEPDPETGNTGATFGITKISPNTGAPYLIYKRFTSPNDSIDLLWDCKVQNKPGNTSLKMRHALARLAVSVILENAPADGTKVLLNRVTLKGDIAESAKLNLSVAGDTPNWTEQDLKSITIYTDSDPKAEGSTDSWGTINNDIRYVTDLPYNWQPDGLNNTEYQNVVTIGGHKGYLYLIPQTSLTLDCTVAYTIMSSGGTKVEGKKKPEEAIVLSPLNGNSTYNLKLKLKDL